NLVADWFSVRNLRELFRILLLQRSTLSFRLNLRLKRFAFSAEIFVQFADTLLNYFIRIIRRLRIVSIVDSYNRIILRFNSEPADIKFMIIYSTCHDHQSL